MYTFLKKVVSGLLPWGSDVPVVEPSEDEKTILNTINNLNFENEEFLGSAESDRKPLGYSEPAHYNVECFKFVHRTGRVTHLCTEYGLIDNVVYFGRNQVSANLKLKLNDEVVYTAYRIKENETERVHKVYGLKNDPLEFEEASEALAHNTNDSEKTEVILALPRVLVGRVTQRRGREVYVEKADVWCNLDKVKASYVPVEGDWVELQAVVTVDELSPDWSGDVVEIRSLKPLLSKSGFGRVTFWSDGRKEGAIENVIYFTRVACENGYSPTLGDEVAYDAVESDQDRFRWRALKVRNNRVFSKASLSEDTESVSEEQTDMTEEAPEKRGISVTPENCSVNVRRNEVTQILLEVKNTKNKKQILEKTRILGNNTCQIKLVSPTAGCICIRAEQAVPFVFECKGKGVGTVGDLVLFYFKGFIIEKTIEINVSADTAKGYDNGSKPDCDLEEADFVMYGPKPWKAPKFILKDRMCIFKIPEKLLKLSSKYYSSKADKEKAVLSYAPFLKGVLEFSHYSNRFHNLLYLEEIAVRMNFKKYNREGVYLGSSDKYFVLEVPGLVEKRPSLIIGDKVIVTQDWSEGNRTKQVGFIHEIHEKEIFILFHNLFHDTYDGSECDVAFEPNMTYFCRAHEAINRAERYLGQKWLFPSAVHEKPPQIQFKIVEEDKTNAVANSKTIPESPKESTVKEKTLTWVNSQLNSRQKLAVIGVLKGLGRPLPYIIFGPPGTGKTATMVEAVIQLYRLMPESRILITTPSNSAADLICERLIAQGGFQPGELVRLMAIYRVMQELVPDSLLPYCTVYTGKDKDKDKIFGRRNKTVSACSIGDLSGRSRITVTTCSTCGQLYLYGFPRGHFSHIFVDEAGQTSEPEVLLSAGFLNTADGMFILAGDPMQLGPVVFCNVAKTFGLGISLLERLISRFPYAMDKKGFPETSGFDPRIITKLVMNYRSVPEILSLSSQMFYNSDLYNVISQTEGKEADIIKRFDFKGEGRSNPAALIFHGVKGRNYRERDSPSWFNTHEVLLVVHYLKKLYSIGLKDTDIGVITPYAKQVSKIRNLLPAYKLAVPKIGSVEEFQGQERQVIILSTVRSSPDIVPSDIKHHLGFVSCPQRLNVALTRARALLIIIGNPALLSVDPYWVNVVRYCVQNKSYTGCRLDKSLLGELKSDDLKTEDTT